MITVIKKIIIKEKEGKRQGKKKTDVRRDSNMGSLSKHYGFTTRPRGLSYLITAKSLNLNKTDVIIMQHIFKET